MQGWWYLIKETGASWSRHKPARLGAALAYYSIFSLGPLILIAIAAAGLVFGEAAVRGEVSLQIRAMLGEAGANAVEAMLAGASRPYQGALATIFGICLLVFSALGVVIQLKDALNTIWDVEPGQGNTLWQFTRSYLISLAAVLSLGFLLLVSLLFTAALAAVGKYMVPYLPEVPLQILGSFASFCFITVMFAMMFKWLPDTHVSWRDVWLGAGLTAILFEIGKALIGVYIGRLGLESLYGGAASLVILLIWVYYSSQILLMGAEFTHVYANQRGSAKQGPAGNQQSRRMLKV
jgi:membrane protein